MKRRVWLLSGLGAAGALVVGWMPPRSRLGRAGMLADASQAAGDHGVALNGWIRIAPDGRVQLACPKSEMGQGVHTAPTNMATLP